ncbi:hypothetical protein PILCRDRAFT_818808 [Piloderma croceum F 1598]|uniref:Uncharacterized protein n=1 Tax=Piloderma croceum (strain F 1598) TaxID=765440 RepID=A0A0C3BBW2_PILCF|nr:hypothetical protein PILCRDRAFT_818808 [Piloderma croceum F 1598]
MSTKLQFYIGEVLDIYKQAARSRYGSVDDANSASSLSFLALRVYLPLQVQLAATEDSDDDMSPEEGSAPLFSGRHRSRSAHARTDQSARISPWSQGSPWGQPCTS